MKHKAHFCLGCVSLLCLLVALDSVNVVMAVSEDPAGRNTPPQSSVSVSTSTELYQGLANPSVSEVVVEQDIYLGMWPDFDRLVIQRPVVVVGRHLKNVWPVLDVSPATGKLELAPNSSITFKGLTLAGWSPAVGHGFLLVSASPAGGSVLVESCFLVQHVSLPYATLGYHLMLHAPRSPNLSGSTQDIILLTWSNASASQVAKASLRVDAPAQLMVEQGQYTVCRRFVFQPTNCQRDDALYVRDWSMIVPYDYSLQGTYGLVLGGHHMSIVNSVMLSSFQMDSTCLEYYPPGECALQRVLRARADEEAAAAKRRKSASHENIITVLVSLGALLLLGVVFGVVFMQYRSGSMRTLLGGVAPPAAGKTTTLLITDIQNSTKLWEELPGAVMDQAIKMHHATVRALLSTHNGYESATEGDSFTCAFHRAQDAARFALAFQSALLALTWPEELLSHEDGCELWVRPCAATSSRRAETRTVLAGSGARNHRRMSLLALGYDMQAHVPAGPSNVQGGAGGVMLETIPSLHDSLHHITGSFNAGVPLKTEEEQMQIVVEGGASRPASAGSQIAHIASRSQSRPQSGQLMSTHNSSSPRTPLNHNYNHPRQSVGSAVADRQTFRRSSTEPPEGFITANALHQAFFSQQGPEAASANASGMPSVAGSAAGSGPGWVPGLLGAMRAAGGSVRSSVRSSHNDGPRGYSSVHPESKDASDERCSEGAMDEEDYTAVLEDLKLEAGATNTDGGGSTGRALAPRVSQSTAKDSSRHGLTQPGTTANPSGNSVIGSNRRGMLAHTLGRLLSSSPGQTRKHLQREEALMAARRSLESGALVSQAGGDGPTTPRRLGKQWSQGHGEAVSGGTSARSSAAAVQRASGGGGGGGGGSSSRQLRHTASSSSACVPHMGRAASTAAAIAADIQGMRLASFNSAMSAALDGPSVHSPRSSAMHSMATISPAPAGSVALSALAAGLPQPVLGVSDVLVALAREAAPGAAMDPHDMARLLAHAFERLPPLMQLALSVGVTPSVGSHAGGGGCHSGGHPSRMGSRTDLLSRDRNSLRSMMQPYEPASFMNQSRQSSSHGDMGSFQLQLGGSTMVPAVQPQVSLPRPGTPGGGAGAGAGLEAAAVPAAAPDSKRLLDIFSAMNNGDDGAGTEAPAAAVEPASLPAPAAAAAADEDRSLGGAAATMHTSVVRDEEADNSSFSLARLTRLPSTGAGGGGRKTSVEMHSGSADASDAAATGHLRSRAQMSSLTTSDASTVPGTMTGQADAYGDPSTPQDLQSRVAQRRQQALGGAGRTRRLSNLAREAVLPEAGQSADDKEDAEDVRLQDETAATVVEAYAIRENAAINVAASLQGRGHTDSHTDEGSDEDGHSSQDEEERDNRTSRGSGVSGAGARTFAEPAGEVEGDHAPQITSAGTPSRRSRTRLERARSIMHFDATEVAGEAQSMTMRWMEYCRLRWPEVASEVARGWAAEATKDETTSSAPVLALRGLRVRIGLHSGVPDPKDCTHNPTTGRKVYGGPAMKAAKLIGDAAAGGMVLMSNTTFDLLLPTLHELLPIIDGSGPVRVIYCGDVDMGDVEGGTQRSLYQLVTPIMVPRVGYLPPLRNVSMVQFGNEHAPVGRVVIGFMHISNAAGMMAELGSLAQRVLTSAKGIIIGAVSMCGGYVVEATDALVLAAFACPVSALAWALRARAGLMEHAWPEEALDSHWLEEVKQWVPLSVATTGLKQLLAASDSAMSPISTTATMPEQNASTTGVSSASAVSTPPVTASGLTPSTRSAEAVALMTSAAASNSALAAGMLAGIQEVSEAGMTGSPGNTEAGVRSHMESSVAGMRDNVRPGRVNLASKRRGRQQQLGMEVLVARGPRIRCGLAQGAVSVDVSEATGRLSYRGKVMNRAARISLKAAEGQVLCPSEVWRRAQQVQDKLLTGTASGIMMLPPPVTDASHHGRRHSAISTASISLRRASALGSKNGLVTTAAVGAPGSGLPPGRLLSATFTGSICLKGVNEPVDLYEVCWQGDVAMTTIAEIQAKQDKPAAAAATAAAVAAGQAVKPSVLPLPSESGVAADKAATKQ